MSEYQDINKMQDNTGTDGIEQMGDAGSEGFRTPAPRASKIKRLIIIVSIAVALFIGIAGITVLQHPPLFVQYHSAEKTYKQGNYTEAYNAFLALGDYKDAPNRAEEALNMVNYTQAVELFEQGEYSQAQDIFEQLGNFLDSPERAKEALDKYILNHDYNTGLYHYNIGNVIGLKNAYDFLSKHVDENYLDTVELVERIPREMYEAALKIAAEGMLTEAIDALEYLKDIDPTLSETLQKDLIDQEHIELDTSLYDINTDLISSYSVSTTPEEFAGVINYMFITDTIRMTLPAKKGQALNDSIAAKILNNIDIGYNMCQALFPDYFSIYNADYTIINNNNTLGSMILYNNGDTGYKDSELLEHVKIVDEFCRESIRILNENLLIGTHMSNRDKAEVLYKWVCYYLEYDEPQDIHDAGVAIQAKRGVCASYTALYNRLCNLVGVRTYGVCGLSDGEIVDNHIWSVQLDEEGNEFYTDATWGDNKSVHNSNLSIEETCEQFCESYNRYNFTGYNTTYFWSSNTWSTHHAEYDFHDAIKLLET